jgi:hypothetical protein
MSSASNIGEYVAPVGEIVLNAPPIKRHTRIICCIMWIILDLFLHYFIRFVKQMRAKYYAAFLTRPRAVSNQNNL